MGDAFAQMSLEVREVQRPTEQEALTGLAAECDQAAAMCIVFQAFGHNVEPEGKSQGNDGLRDGAGPGFVWQSVDEGAIDLQLGNG